MIFILLLVLLIISLALGAYFLYSGITNKPPFESMQTTDGWDDSRFPNKYWAIGIGIVIIVSDILILIAFLITVV